MVEVSASAARRDRILRAAEEVLDAMPFGAELALTHVAERAQVDPSTLWRTFGRGDEGIIRALATRRSAEMWQRTTPRIGESPHDHLVRGMGEVMDMWREYGRLWAAVMRLTITSAPFAAWWYEEVMGRWTPLLAEAFAGPESGARRSEVERQVILYLNGAWLAFHRTARRATELRAEGHADRAHALEEQTLEDVLLLGRNAFGLTPSDSRPDHSVM